MNQFKIIFLGFLLLAQFQLIFAGDGLSQECDIADDNIGRLGQNDRTVFHINCCDDVDFEEAFRCLAKGANPMINLDYAKECWLYCLIGFAKGDPYAYRVLKTFMDYDVDVKVCDLYANALEILSKKLALQGTADTIPKMKLALEIFEEAKEVLKFTIKKGWDINSRNIQGETILHHFSLRIEEYDKYNRLSLASIANMSDDPLTFDESSERYRFLNTYYAKVIAMFIELGADPYTANNLVEAAFDFDAYTKWRCQANPVVIGDADYYETEDYYENGGEESIADANEGGLIYCINLENFLLNNPKNYHEYFNPIVDACLGSSIHRVQTDFIKKFTGTKIPLISKSIKDHYWERRKNFVTVFNPIVKSNKSNEKNFGSDISGCKINVFNQVITSIVLCRLITGG